MKRRILALALALCMALSVLPLGAAAASGNPATPADGGLAEAKAPRGFEKVDGSTPSRRSAASGSCGENLTWSLTDGELVISGSGAMDDFANTTAAPWHVYAASIQTLTVQAGVTNLSQYAFAGLYNLTEVSIPDTVTMIGRMAFIECSRLEKIELPASVATISYALFGDCTSLAYLKAPGVTAINDYAFQNTAFRAFELGKNVTSVSDLAFFLTNIEMFTVEAGNSVFSAQNGVLYQDGGKTLVCYPQGSKAEAFSIPAGVTKVAAAAFSNTASLHQVEIPNTVTELGMSAFQGSGLTSVTIPDSVTAVGDFTFYKSSLQAVRFGTGLKATSYQMFRECHDLTQISFPATPLALDAHTFAYCTSLTEVKLPGSVAEIGNGCFGECYKLKAFQSDGLKEIPFQAFFNCRTLETLTLNNVEKIMRASFYGCTSLKGVKLPATIQYVHNVAFPAATVLECENQSLSKFGTNGLAPIQPVQITGKNCYDEAYAVLELVNAERAREGLEPLSMDKTLLDCAMRRSAELSLLFSHTRPDGACIFEMNSLIYAENVAAGQGSAAEVMESWMNSSGHRQNILTADYRTIGIGCFQIGGRYYWAQNFGIAEAVPPERPVDTTVQQTIGVGLYEIPEATISNGTIFDFGGSNAPYTIEFSLRSGTGFTEGQTAQAQIVVTNSGFHAGVVIDNAGCRWSSEDSKIATVNDSGLIRAVAGGTTNIRMDLGLIHLGQTVKVEHQYTASATTPPTCTEPGKTTYTCACGDSYQVDGAAALGHSWDVGKLTLAPTTDVSGVKTYTCVRCGETKTEQVPPLGEQACTGDEGCPGHRFADMPVPANWAHKAIDYVLRDGLMNGMSETAFGPSTAMNRGMLVTILWRLAGTPAPKTEAQFSDVDASRYYAKPVAWAAENGIVNGMGNNKFQPNTNITREQVATILYRYASYSQLDTSARADLSKFPDADKVSSFAKDALSWANAAGLINGKRNTQTGVVSLSPRNSTTRAELATVLMNFMEKVVK